MDNTELSLSLAELPRVKLELVEISKRNLKQNSVPASR